MSSLQTLNNENSISMAGQKSDLERLRQQRSLQEQTLKDTTEELAHTKQARADLQGQV